jgi:hypothetical protein
VLRVVGVEALLDELAPAERVVVGVDAGRLAAELASRLLGEDTRPELLLVLTSVPSLSCAAPLRLSLLPVVGTAPTLIGVLRAAWG